MYNYGYMHSGYSNAGMFLGIAFLISLVVGIVLFFTFLNKKNEFKFTGFLGWLYDFLSFNKLMIDSLLKILYLIIACYMTLGGFFLMFSSFLGGLCMIILGNVLIRLVYEFAMLLIIICQNTSEINKKLGGTTTKEFVDNFGFENKSAAMQQSAPVENYYQTTPSMQTNSQPENQPAKPEPTEKTCSKCGVKLSPDAAFCYNCGEKQ